MHLKKETKKAKNELLCDINAMKEQKLIEEKSLRENLDKMYGREKEIGTGLIMAKTGKLIPEKVQKKTFHIFTLNVRQNLIYFI